MTIMTGYIIMFCTYAAFYYIQYVWRLNRRSIKQALNETQPLSLKGFTNWKDATTQQKQSCSTFLQTCAFLQEKVFNFFLVFCRILQESCVHVPARFLQDPTKCKKKLRTFSCKIVQVLQDTLARLFLLGVAK